MPRLARDESGQLFIDEGGGQLQPVTEQEAAFFLENQGGAGIAQAALGGAESIAAGAAALVGEGEGAERAMQRVQELRREQQLLEADSPIGAGLAQFAPQVAAGVATGGAGLPFVMGTEAALGAAGSPEAPWTGAAIGAGTVGALGAAGRVLQRAADSSMPAVGMVPSARAGGGGSATDRVLGAIDEGTAGPRVHEGLLTADELEALTGRPLTAGQRAQLEARANNPAEIEAAMRKRYTEDLLGKQGGLFGEKVMEANNALRASLDDQVRRVTGIPQGVAFSDSVIGQQLTAVGNDIGNLMDQVGWVQVGDDALEDMTQALSARTSQAAAPVAKHVEEIKRLMDEQGHVTGAQYQDIYRALGRVVEAQEGGTALLAEQVRRTMEDKLQETAGQAVKDALQAARYKYRILKRLGKPGAVGPDGSINAQSFRRSLQKGTSDKRKGSDPLARLAETINTITSPTVHTGNTLQRFGNWAAQAGNAMTTPQGASSVVTTGGVAAALSGLGSMLGGL